MANSRSSGTNKEYATVDTIPAGGYWTNPVNPRKLWNEKKVQKIWFSIRETENDSSGASDTSNIGVELQFKCPGDNGWQKYFPIGGTALMTGNRFVLEDIGEGVLWRAGVRDDVFIIGSVTFGFDW